MDKLKKAKLELQLAADWFNDLFNEELAKEVSRVDDLEWSMVEYHYGKLYEAQEKAGANVCT